MSTVPRWRWGDAPEPVAELVARGGILAVPTESSYALAVDPRNPEGVSAVYRVKRRAAAKPLPVVVADVEGAVALGVARELPALARLAALWPAPLTAVLPVAAPPPAAAGREALALRVPAHRRLRELLRRLGSLTATSANRSGEAPLLEPGAAAALLAGEDALVVDEGPLPGGPPSTLVALEGGRFRLLRAGAFAGPALERLLAEAVE